MSAIPSNDDGVTAAMATPSPQCLQDWGALQSTGEHSRAQRIDNKGNELPASYDEVARHQPVSVLRRRGFDSRRLHHPSLRHTPATRLRHCWTKWSRTGILSPAGLPRTGRVFTSGTRCGIIASWCPTHPGALKGTVHEG